MLWLPFVLIPVVFICVVLVAASRAKAAQEYVEEVNSWSASQLRAEGDKMMDRSLGSQYISDANYYKNQADIFYRKAEDKKD